MTSGHDNQAYGDHKHANYPHQAAGAPAPGYDAGGATGYPHQQTAPGARKGEFAHPVQTPPPMDAQLIQPLPGQWSTGLCDCGDDCANCCVTFWCPCIPFGQIAEVVDQGTTSCLLAGSIWVLVCAFTGMPCIVSCIWRGKLRAKYNLPAGSCGDFCLHCWCEPCAICQEYRELKNRGLDPSLGWNHLSQQEYAKAPMGIPMQAPMYR